MRVHSEKQSIVLGGIGNMGSNGVDTAFLRACSLYCLVLFFQTSSPFQITFVPMLAAVMESSMQMRSFHDGSGSIGNPADQMLEGV